MTSADDGVIAEHAKVQSLTLLTRDFDFSDIRNYVPGDYTGIVVFDLPEDAVAELIDSVFEKLLGDHELLAHLAGHLAIVRPDRVRLRS